MNELYTYLALILGFGLLGYILHRNIKKDASVPGSGAEVPRIQMDKSQKTAKLLMDFVGLLIAFSILKAPLLFIFPYGILTGMGPPVSDSVRLLVAISPALFQIAVLIVARKLYTRGAYSASMRTVFCLLLLGLVAQVSMAILIPHLIW